MPPAITRESTLYDSFVVWKCALRRYGIFACTTILRHEPLAYAIAEVRVQEFFAGYGDNRRRWS